MGREHHSGDRLIGQLAQGAHALGMTLPQFREGAELERAHRARLGAGRIRHALRVLVRAEHALVGQAVVQLHGMPIRAAFLAGHAADALLLVVVDDARFRILLHGSGGAVGHAGRVLAVAAGHRYVVGERRGGKGTGIVGLPLAAAELVHLAELLRHL